MIFGHVPFGHYGERMLNSICKERGLGLFLHNAQSVRVLQTLENRGEGLNMTVQVLDGILCHNGEMLEKRYEPDKFTFAVLKSNYGIFAVRGTRGIPADLDEALNR